MKKKFCCDSFMIRYTSEKKIGLNIRVVKLSSYAINRMASANLTPKCDKIFYITEGYLNDIHDDNIKRIVINYCPFCGKELIKMYGKNDDYVQEID